jgi:hypothetical protein
MSSAPDHNRQLGFDKQPDRYASDLGRETIDLIRDSMTDDQFVAFCYGQVIRYRDRAGKKESAQVDLDKARFYEKMALHVQNPEDHDDPRNHREGFTLYRRQEYPHRKYNIPPQIMLKR